MLQQRICQQCGRSFEGGPRAYYCPSCRAERQREQNAEFQRRKRKGNYRPLGSIDKCEQCGKDYVVEGGQQRFCPDCQPIHAKEYDRETAIEFYHNNKDRINPVRNQRRRKGPKTCVICGKEFTTNTRAITCSPECRRKDINKKWNERYGEKRKLQRREKRAKGGNVDGKNRIHPHQGYAGIQEANPGLLRTNRQNHNKPCGMASQGRNEKNRPEMSGFFM